MAEARRSAPRWAASGRATRTKSAARWPSDWAICIGPSSTGGSNKLFAPKSELLGPAGGTGIEARRPRGLRSVRRLRQTARALRGRHDGVSARSGEGASGCCSRAPRVAAGYRSRHLPVRHEQQQFGRRRVGGSGVPGRYITKVLGIVKAYYDAGRRRPVSDRTRQRDRRAHPRPRQRIRHGDRRPRRCGWFDAVAVRCTARLGGVDSLAS